MVDESDYSSLYVADCLLWPIRKDQTRQAAWLFSLPIFQALFLRNCIKTSESKGKAGLRSPCCVFLRNKVYPAQAMTKPRQIWHRQLLYSFMWLIALAELGLTAYHIHFTTENSGTYDPLIAELLAVSILTALTIPLVLKLLQDAGNIAAASNDSTSGASLHKQTDTRNMLSIILLHQSTLSSLILSSWVMWLVGAAVATHNWLTRGVPEPRHAGRVLVAIVGLAWAAFATLTLARFLATLERFARKVLEILVEV